MQTLLAFVDFSEVTAAVVKAATEIARAFQMDLLLLHVSTPDAEYEGHDFRADTSRQGVAGEMQNVHRALHAMAADSAERGISATALLVRGTSARGNVVPKMLREASRIRPALIVMGTHGYGRLHQALLGSASEAVVHKVKCPVLLVPSRATKPVWPQFKSGKNHRDD
ncbi:MAG: universal stress protein [Tepidisphaeraceae bacterium]|jgi:nucleotide-binding universal stress UspA family protein